MEYAARRWPVAWMIPFLCLLLLCCPVRQVFAEIEGGLRVLHEYDTRILLNGTYVVADVKADISDDRVAMLPLRAIFEAAGYRVDWDPLGNRAIVELPDGRLALDLNNGTAYRSGAAVGNFPYQVKLGRTLTVPAFFSLADGVDARFDVATHTAIVSVTPVRPDDVVFYDLGVRQIAFPSGSERNVTLNGGLAVPAGQGNPVVLILHGSHPLEDAVRNRYDLGFSYLLKAFASRGYLALSPNVNLQYSFLDGEPVGQERVIAIVKETVAALRLANAGMYDGFGADLTGKLDLQRVVLVGHSRGGGGVFYVADALRAEPDVEVVGLAAISPTDVYIEDLASIDVPTAFVIPELDGDVVGLDGYSYFDAIASNPSRASDAQLVYLYGANHNAFNEGILPQDQGKFWYTGEKATISAGEQRGFATDYLLALVDAVTSGTPIHTIASSLAGELFGQRVMVSNYLGNSTPVHVAHAAGVTTSGATLEQVISSNQVTVNTAGLFNPGGSGRNLELSKISWDGDDAGVAFALEGQMRNLSSMGYLSLYLAPDSTSSLNSKQNQTLRVELADASGKTASYLLDRATPVLAYQDGHPVFDGEFFSTITPLGIVNLPIARFDGIEGIDRTQVEEVRLRFTETVSGCLMVRAVFVSPVE